VRVYISRSEVDNVDTGEAMSAIDYAIELFLREENDGSDSRGFEYTDDTISVTIS